MLDHRRPVIKTNDKSTVVNTFSNDKEYKRTTIGRELISKLINSELDKLDKIDKMDKMKLAEFENLLIEMLCLNPNNRIKPAAALAHPFFQSAKTALDIIVQTNQTDQTDQTYNTDSVITVLGKRKVDNKENYVFQQNQEPNCKRNNLNTKELDSKFI
jgi:serine/threonine protein kinase